tara:strand:+ start:276 stop:1889 length:1614 start_codon:yes stop_codon:yes gene_type:complete
LAESDAQFRKRRAKEDAQAIKMGKLMYQKDLASKPLSLRRIDSMSPIEKVSVSVGVPSGMLNQDRSVKQIDRLIHGARMVGDPEYAKMFEARPIADIKRASPSIGLNTIQKVAMPMGNEFAMSDMDRLLGVKKTIVNSKLAKNIKEDFDKLVPDDIRRAEDSPLPGDQVPAMLEPGEYVLNRNAVKAIGKKELDRINNKIKPRFSDKVKKKMKDVGMSLQVGANRDMYEQYIQTGGFIERAKALLNKGAEEGEEVFAKGRAMGGKALDFLNKAKKRYGGDALQASRTMDIMEGATDSEGNPISIEQAKLMRDKYGLGKRDFGMGVGAFSKALKDDVTKAGKTGAGLISMGLKKGKEALEKGADFMAEGDREKNALKFGGQIFKELAALQGFGDGGDFEQFRPKKDMEVVGSSEDEVDVDSEEMDELRQEAPGVVLPESEEMEEFREENPYIARPETQEMSDTPLEDITDPLGLSGSVGMSNEIPLQQTLSEQEQNAVALGRNPYRMSGTGIKGYQLGGQVSMDGFIQQAFRNVYGRN